MAVFGASSSLPHLVDRGSKLSDQQIRMPYCFRRTLTLSSAEACFSNFILVTFPVLCSVAFRSSFVCSLLLDLDSFSYGRNNPD